MKKFDYSRDKEIAKARSAYSEAIKRMAEGKEEASPEGLLYHALLTGRFNSDLNAKARALAAGSSKKGGDKAGYAELALRVFDSPSGGDYTLRDGGMAAALLNAMTPFTGYKGDADGYLAKAASGAEEIATRTLLRAIWGLVVAGHKSSSGTLMWKYMDAFLTRFEVTGKLYDRYMPDIRKGLGRHEDLESYLLLSVSLLSGMEGGPVNFKALNAALKLNDLFGFLMGNIPRVEPMPLLIHSLEQEKEIMRTVYNDKGFRMPSDR